MNPLNPNNKWRLGFRPINAAPNRLNPGGNLTPANHASPGNTKATTADSLRIPQGVTVQLPRNLYAPPGSQSLNLVTGTVSLAPGFTGNVFEYVAPQGAMTQFLSYALTTAKPGITVFTPQIDGARILPFHGDPNVGFYGPYQITQPTGPDTGANSLVEAQLSMTPGQRLTWYVANPALTATDVSIRMVGYLISTQALEDTRFGG